MSQIGPQKGSFDANATDYRVIVVNSRDDIPAPGRTFGMGSIPKRVKGSSYSDKVRSRDVLHFVITDVNPQSAFSGNSGPFQSGPIEVPDDGRVTIPYVGELQVMARTLSEISVDFNEKLKPISNTARGSVNRTNRLERTANVIGEVKRPGPVPIEKNNFSSLDLLAASGGPTNSEHLYKYILRRDGQDYNFDYQGFRKSSFNVEEGDLLNVTSDISNRFFVMGAINKPTTVPFPVPAPTLADALGATAGFDERRSDPSGVFIFRKGSPDEVYTLNLKEPGAMFLAQRFPIRGEDLVYVTEAPLARWNRLIMQILPFSQLSQAAYNLDRISQ